MAIEPSFLGDGYFQRRSDTKWTVVCKKLGEVQSALGASALPANNPRRSDTKRVLLQKWLCALNSVSYTG